jgi:twitching motility protein PilT
MVNFNELLTYAFTNDASDIHLAAANPPNFRIHGDIVTLKVPPMTSEEIKNILYSVMNDKQRATYEEFLEIDFAIHLNDKRFRINAYNTLTGPAAALRIIKSEIRTLKELNAPEILTSITNLTKGIVLVTGPTGSGKSTTVAALVNHINKSQYKHILTIEDPIEFVHKSDKSLINHREIGTHSLSFAKALKSALREDPDVILVGELRDLETIHLALTAAETGHLVIATLHTSSAAQTVDRIIDVFPAEEKEMIRAILSNSIECIVSQILVKKSENNGRVAAFETLIATSAIRNLIREGKIPQIYSLMQINSKIGMTIMKDSIYDLLSKNIISKQTAKDALNISDPDKAAAVGNPTSTNNVVTSSNANNTSSSSNNKTSF